MEQHQEDLQMFASELVRTFEGEALQETCPEKERINSAFFPLRMIFKRRMNVFKGIFIGQGGLEGRLTLERGENRRSFLW